MGTFPVMVSQRLSLAHVLYIYIYRYTDGNGPFDLLTNSTFWPEYVHRLVYWIGRFLVQQHQAGPHVPRDVSRAHTSMFLRQYEFKSIPHGVGTHFFTRAVSP